MNVLRNKMIKVWILLLCCLCIGWIQKKSVCASSARVTISTDSVTMVSGNTFYVIITVTSSEAMSGFEGYFSYNNRAMQFITGGSVVSGNDDEFSISDTNRSDSRTSLKYSIKFMARKKGSSTITLKSPYNAYAASDASKMSVSFNELNIKVVKASEALSSPDVQSDVKEGLDEKQQDSKVPPAQGVTPQSEMPEGDNTGAVPESTATDHEEMPTEALEEQLPENGATTGDGAAAEGGQQDPDTQITLLEEKLETSQKRASQLVCMIILLLALIGILMICLVHLLQSRRSWKQEAREREDILKDITLRDVDVPAQKTYMEDQSIERPGVVYTPSSLTNEQTTSAESMQEISSRLEKKRKMYEK